MSKVRAELKIQGRVQGVFYRQSMKNAAIPLGLTGWVKNCSDGSVAVILEGEKEAVDSAIEWCRQGPPAAHVTAVTVDWQNFLNEFSDFGIRA